MNSRSRIQLCSLEFIKTEVPGAQCSPAASNALKLRQHWAGSLWCSHFIGFSFTTKRQLRKLFQYCMTFFGGGRGSKNVARNFLLLTCLSPCFSLELNSLWRGLEDLPLAGFYQFEGSLSPVGFLGWLMWRLQTQINALWALEANGEEWGEPEGVVGLWRSGHTLPFLQDQLFSVWLLPWGDLSQW